MIVLLRHGQTEWNRDGRTQGRGDSPLTDLGKAQARAMAETTRPLLAGRPTPRLVSSPQGRALATARIVAAHLGLSLDIPTDDRLMEQSFGAWEGQLSVDTYEKLRDIAPHRRWFHAPGGETVEEIQTRAQSWLDDHQALDSPLIAVSHGITGKIIRGLYAGLSTEEMLRRYSPQDAVFRLDDGRVKKIRCAPVTLDLISE
jgi:probable phosphoglycerate mutase